MDCVKSVCLAICFVVLKPAHACGWNTVIIQWVINTVSDNAALAVLKLQVLITLSVY